MPAQPDWPSFLGRPPLALDYADASSAFSGKRILITGAGGSIGSALTQAISHLRPAQLILLEASERNLYETNLSLAKSSVEVVSVLGSVCQASLLADVFERHRPHVVYHAAAFKHVPLMELNPFAAIENNALGTELLLQAAVNAESEQLILLSTDKAVEPLSMMGASKRIAELILLSTRSPSLRLKAVRLGNVLGSEGSIVPLFMKQMLAGEPVTVTHREAERYFLTPADAVALLLFASSAEAAPGVLVPDLGEPVRVEALARHMMRSGAEVPIVFTQLRPGDKLREAMISAGESYVAGPVPPLRAVRSPALSPEVLEEVLQQLEEACRLRSLPRLMEGVLRAVPEYRPSILLQPAESLAAGKGVTA